MPRSPAQSPQGTRVVLHGDWQGTAPAPLQPVFPPADGNQVVFSVLLSLLTHALQFTEATFDLLLTLKQQHECALKMLKLEELKRRGKNKSGKKSYSVFESKGACNSSQRSYP